MKRIVIFFLCFLAFNITVNAQLGIFDKKVQDDANDKLAYVFDYLKSDTMLFKNLILPDPNTKVVLMHDAFGRPLYVLITSEVFDSVNSQIAAISQGDQLLGLEFNLTYLSAFSWQKRKDIKKISNRYQKAITKVFNEKVKFCLMQQGSHTVKGVRIIDKNSPLYGQKIPDFTDAGSEAVVKKSNTPVAPPIEKTKVTEKEKVKQEDKKTEKKPEPKSRF